jgi:hypothetical protein
MIDNYGRVGTVCYRDIAGFTTPERASGGLQHPFSCVYICSLVLNVSSHTSHCNDDSTCLNIFR